ncbi:MAG: prepilin-type N-terminal cleavage/methylation domain-containing protein [Pirellulales bacterium]
MTESSLSRCAATRLFRRAGRRGGRRDAGFTLVELLIVVVIVSLVAGMMLFALSGARNNALERKTRTTIQRLSEALQARWNTYETRRIVWQDGQAPSSDLTPIDAARRRLKGLRELMRMELPQAWSEVETTPTSGIVQPAANRAYQRRVAEARGKDGKPAKQSADYGTYAGAECLYMILTTRMGEEESIRDSIKDSEIGDVDGDGLFEFLDGWGNPILFIRWAPAFESELQPAEARTNPRRKEYHDPFDPLMTDDRSFALFPLIYSAGRDKKYDIHHQREGDMNNPYAQSNMGQPMDENSLGEVKDGQDNSRDNIHNHMAL